MYVSAVGRASARVVKAAREGVLLKSALSLTPEAVARVKELLKRQPEMNALRVRLILPFLEYKNFQFLLLTFQQFLLKHNNFRTYSYSYFADFFTL